MNIRPVAGVAAGLIVWWALFMLIGTVFGLAWPAYRSAAHLMFETGDFSLFSTAMLFMNWVLFILDGLATGWIASRIGRHWITAPVVALLYFAYAAVNHYYLLWDKLPHWYNLIVPLVISESIVLGGRLQARANEPAPASAVT